MNPKDCVWENLYQIIMKTILQEKETIHYSITFGSQIYSYASKLKKNPAGIQCAHMGVLFLMETASFICAIRGRARDRLRSGHSGPKTIAASWPQSFPEPCAVCINPSSQWTRRSFGFHVFHWCVSCTSWCLQSHDPGLMTHLVAPLCVPGRPRLHGQGTLSQHRGCPK